MPEYVLTLLAIVAAFIVAALVVAAGSAFVRRTLDTMDVVTPENRKALHERAQRLLRALKLLAFGAAALASVSLGLQRIGITEPSWDLHEGGRWLLRHGLDLIIIDQPTEGLAPKIVELVGEYLKKLKEKGISVLLIEQKLTIAMDISDRTLVMRHGSIVFQGTPDELRANSYVRKEWLEV